MQSTRNVSECCENQKHEKRNLQVRNSWQRSKGIQLCLIEVLGRHVGASKFTCDTSRVQNGKQTINIMTMSIRMLAVPVAEPKNGVWYFAQQIKRIEQIARDFNTCPTGDAESGEKVSLCRRGHKHNRPQNPYTRKHLKKRSEHRRSDESNHAVQYFHYCRSLYNLED